MILTPSGQSGPAISCHRSTLSRPGLQAQTPSSILRSLRADVTQQAETKHAQCHKFVSNIFMGPFRGRSIFQVFLLLIIVSGQSAEGGWAVPTPLWLTAGHTHCKHRDTLITSSDIIPALVKRIVSSLSRARVISVSLKYLARPSGPLP